MPVYKDDKTSTWFVKKLYIDVFGKRKYITKRGFKTKALAQKHERIMLLEVNDVSKQPVKFDDLFQLYMNYKKDRTKERTIYNYEMLYKKQIRHVFGEMYINKITIPMIEQFQNQLMEQGLSNQYLEKIQSVLKSTLRFGVRKLMIEKNPFDYVDYVKNMDEIKKEMEFFTDDQFNVFINIIEEDSYKIVFTALYWTGMRIGELQARTWNDLNFRTADLRIHSNYDNKNKRITNSTKTGLTRIIYIPEHLLKLLQDKYAIDSKIDGFSNDFYIFGANTPIPHKSVENAKNRYILRYNETHTEQLPKIRLHDFRHSHVSFLANNGADSWDIAERLGHSKDMVERTYSHMFPEKRNKMKKLLG